MRSVRESPEPSYRDIKVSIRFPNGGVGEIIVASKFYDDVKFNRGGHEAYEVIRTIEAKWPNEDKMPQEIRDIYYEFKTFSKNIYSRGSSLEDIRMAYSSASASLTRLPSSNSLFAIQNSDVIGILNSISEGFQRKVPYSLDSYATPSRSLIQNDISNSSKEKSPDKGIIQQSGGIVNDEFRLSGQPYQTSIFDTLNTPGGLDAFAKREGMSPERKNEMRKSISTFNEALRNDTFSTLFKAIRSGERNVPELMQKALDASEDGQTVSRIVKDYFDAGEGSIAPLIGSQVRTDRDAASLFFALRSPYAESFKIAFLDAENKVLDIRVVSLGGINFAPVDTNGLFKNLPAGTKSFIVSHNHPSGIPRPSGKDDDVTNLAKNFGVKNHSLQMLDHIITDGDCFYSYAHSHYVYYSTDHKANWELALPGRSIFENGVEGVKNFIQANLRNEPDGKYIHAIFLNFQGGINAIRRIPLADIVENEAISRKKFKQALYQTAKDVGSPKIIIDACGAENIGNLKKTIVDFSIINSGDAVTIIDCFTRNADGTLKSMRAENDVLSALEKSVNNNRTVFYTGIGSNLVYGSVNEATGEIVLNENAISPKSAISEYTKLWAQTVRINEPVLWQRGISILKKSPLWDKIKKEYSYRNDDEIASEVLAELSGIDGSKLLQEMLDGTTVEETGKFLVDFWTNVKNRFIPWAKNEKDDIADIRAFSLMPVADLVAGRNPTSDLSDRQFTIATSEKFIRDHGDWMNSPDSVDVELDAHGEPVLDGSGHPMPKLSQAGSVRDGEQKGRSVNLGNVADIESAGTGNHNTSVTREGIIQLVKTLFPNVAVEGKTTHKMRNALGWFEVGKGMIRLRNRGNTAVLMHELGHSIDEVCHVGAKPSNSMSDSVKIPTIIRQQMIEIGKGLYGISKPAGGYASEGWAEFMKHYLIGNDESLRRQTPELLDWFLRTWAPQNKEVFGKLEKIRTAISNFKQQTPEETVRAFWNSKYPFSMKFAEWRERNDLTKEGLIYKWIDKKHFLYEQMKKAGVYVDYTDEKLPPEKVSKAIKNDPYLKATLYQGSSAAKTVQAVLEYTTDLSGVKRTGKSLSDALRPVRGKDKEFLKRFIDYAVARQALVYSDRGLDSGLLESEAKQVVDKLQCKEYDEALQEVTDWSRRVLHLLVEGGAMTEDEFERIKQANPIYIKPK